MRDDERAGDAISANVNVTGSNAGQIAIGNEIEQRQALGDAAVAAVTEAEREQVRLAFAHLREQVAAQAPPEQRAAAVERVEELQQAVFAQQPDLTTIQYVTRWFRRNLPALAGSVTALVINPLVGRLVQVAGDRLAELVGGEGE
ncbi:MAG: hypothetical protein JSS99_07280 [Actinobacteria bacterium]|nr:hypothetical protein [Actinomycetota bacterium]